MSDEASTPGGEGAVAPAVTPVAAELPAELSINDAARALADARWKRNNPEAAKAAEAPAPSAVNDAVRAHMAGEETPPNEELSDEDSADPETDPGEDTTEAEPEDKLPPIERPRSWTKDEDAEWQSLPRATQQKIVDREQERDKGLRRSQNEAAEKLKGLTAKEQEIEKVRSEYEAKLPAIMQALQDVQAGQFSDVKTVDDVTRLANEDPFRYLQWQAHQQKVQAVAYEMEQAKSRQTSEQKTAWAKHVESENAKAAEMHPELADAKQAEKLQKSAVELLEDKGFTKDELTRLANGDDKLSIFDHRVQSLLIDGVKFRQAKAAPSKVVPPTLPKVERPGVARPQGSAASDKLQALTKQFNANPSVENATALRLARLRSGQRKAS